MRNIHIFHQAPFGVESRRFPLRGLFFLLLLFFLMAGRNANAVYVNLGGVIDTYYINSSVHFNIDCTPYPFETRTHLGWNIEGGPSGYGGGDTGYDFSGPFQESVKVSTFAKPGGQYKVNGYCSGTFENDYETLGFTVLPLIGSAAIATDKKKITANGSVGNGADRAVVYVDGAVAGEASGLTSNFSVEVAAEPGDHKVEVYAYFETHYQLIGEATVSVYEAPVVENARSREFIQNPRYMLTGLATSEAKIKETWYEWQVPVGTVGGKQEYISYPEEKRVDLAQAIGMEADGKHWFRFWVKAKDNQATMGSWTSVILDRQKPKLENQTVAKDNFIGEDTVLRVKVDDYDPRGGKEASGVNSVMVQVTDKNDKKSDWLYMRREESLIQEEGRTIEAEYMLPLKSLFADLPAGDVKFQIWADDGAGNADYSEIFVYKKAELPVASVSVPASFTNVKDGRIALAFHAESQVDIKKMWLDIWKADANGRQVKVDRTELGVIKSKNIHFALPFTFPQGEGKYFFHAIAQAEDGQQNDLSKKNPAQMVFDKTPPTIDLPKQAPDSKLKSDWDMKFNVEDKEGSGVKDVQIQICQEGVCGAWITDIPNNGKDEYWQTLPVDSLASGPFQVTVWAQDEAENEIRAYGDFTKELDAADAVAPALSFKAADGSEANTPFYSDTQRLLRLTVTPKVKVTGIAVAYALPAGLSPAGNVAVNGALSRNVPAAAAAQLSQWKGSGNLLADIDLEQDAVLVIDIPVTMSAQLPRVKISAEEQTTAFEVTGKNFTNAARAEASWRADWKKAPADMRAAVSRAFDLSAPEDIVLFDKVSGGYDTAEPAKWNRNTLHCGADPAACARDPFGNGVKLRFTEQASKKTVDLILKGHRHQTLLTGRPTQTGALNATANPGADAGVDAEARFSITLPKSELARLPSGGQWRAALIMDLKDPAGQRLAGFDSNIALEVSDKTDMSLKPPRIELLEGSRKGKSRSGDFRGGDELIYRITFEAARDLERVRLELKLPPGLERSDRLRQGEGSMPVILNDGWNADLLQHPEKMKRNQKLVIDVPLRIGAGSKARFTTTAHAYADGFDPLPSAEAVLNVQRRFDVSESLGLVLEMAGQPDRNQDAVVAQQAPFAYRIVLASREHELDGLKLAYRLPGGMQMAGKPVLRDIPALAKVKLNAQWDGDADIDLLAAGAELPRAQNITIEIPVMVKDAVDDAVYVQSTISAGAANLNGELQKSHRVRIREREAAAGNRVRIVKSMDGDAIVQPGALIRYQIRVSNHTFKTVRNLLIRDRAPDHTTLVDASCGKLPASACRTLTLGDKDVVDGRMTHAALCSGGGPQSDPQGKHVFWCLNGDLEPLADYTVNYSVQINGVAPAASAPSP